MESDYHWLVTIGLVTSSIIAITANSFLLLVFYRRRGLRTVPNRFVINLLITNLLSSILLIPFLLADQEAATSAPTNQTTILQLEQLLLATEEDNILIMNTSTILCYFAQSSTNFTCTASIFSILLIGINQYFGVIHSLRYHCYITKMRCTMMIMGSWLVALVFACLSMATDSALWQFCERRQGDVGIFNTIYASLYLVGVILVPFVGICVIYFCISAAAHGNSERMRTTAQPSDYTKVPGMKKVQSAPSFTQISSDSTRTKVARTISDRTPPSKFITNLRHKLSNASGVFRYREETRAAKISILVIFMVLICYIPYGITLVLHAQDSNVQTKIIHYLSLILLTISNVISPFLFGYRNKRIQREIAKIFGHKRQSLTIAATKPRALVPNIPEVIVTDNERKNILKHVTWTGYKKCQFITVPSCMNAEARGSFSSASTQISTED